MATIERKPLAPLNALTKITEADRSTVYQAIGKELNYLLNGPGSFFADGVQLDTQNRLSGLEQLRKHVSDLQGVVDDPANILGSVLDDLRKLGIAVQGGMTYEDKHFDPGMVVKNNENLPSTEDSNIVGIDPDTDSLLPNPRLGFPNTSPRNLINLQDPNGKSGSSAGEPSTAFPAEPHSPFDPNVMRGAASGSFFTHGRFVPGSNATPLHGTGSFARADGRTGAAGPAVSPDTLAMTPQYHPETGVPLRFLDGSPVVGPSPEQQRLGGILKNFDTMPPAAQEPAGLFSHLSANPPPALPTAGSGGLLGMLMQQYESQPQAAIDSNPQPAPLPQQAASTPQRSIPRLVSMRNDVPISPPSPAMVPSQDELTPPRSFPGPIFDFPGRSGMSGSDNGDWLASMLAGSTNAAARQNSQQPVFPALMAYIRYLKQADDA